MHRVTRDSSLQTPSFCDKRACLATQITLFVVGVLASIAFAVCLTQGIGSISYLALAGGGVALALGALLRFKARISDVKTYRLQISNPVDNTLVTEFFEAISEENVNQVRELLDSHPSLATCRDPDDGETPTSVASRVGRKTITQILLAKGAPADIADSSGKLPIHWAAFGGNKEVISMIFEKAPHLIDALDSNGNTPLHFAAGKDEKGDVVACLHKSGAKLESKNLKGYTPLFCAVIQGRSASVQKLLELGADLASTDALLKETPLHYVCRLNGPALLKVMLPRASKALTIKDKAGMTPFDYAKAFKDKKGDDGHPEETVYTILTSSS